MREYGQKIRLTSMVKTSGCAAKLPPDKLHEVIDSLALSGSDKLIGGFESADDALIYRVAGDIVSVQTVDFFPPMVDDPFIFGQIAAANALSDIYAMGGEPEVAMNLLCFPSCLPLSVMHDILSGGLDKVKEAGAVLAGGHTISDPTPKYGLSVTGYMKECDVWKNSGALAGDAVVLTKALGVGVINTAAKGDSAEDYAVKAAIESMRRLNSKARNLGRQFRVHAATDVTGFALAGHSFEVASASGVTIEYDTASLPVLPDALELAEFGFLPEGMYSNLDYVSSHIAFSSSVKQNFRDLVCTPETSGGLLLFMPESDAAEFAGSFGEECCAVIGHVCSKRDADVVFS